MKVFLLLCFGFFLCVGSAQDSTLNFQDSITKDSTFAASLQSQDSNQTFPFKTGKSPLDGVNGFQYFGVIGASWFASISVVCEKSHQYTTGYKKSFTKIL